MEGINKTLFEEVEKNITSELKNKIEKFMEVDADNYEERQGLALDISSDILYTHSKEDLPKIAISLANLERNLKDIQPYQRDHVCHALLTFLLGYFMILKLNLEKHLLDFLFQWKVVALLHDIGYPLEITDRINNEFFSYYEKNVLNEKAEFSPMGGSYLSKYLSLYTKDKSQNRDTIDLINKRLEEWQIILNTPKIFNQMTEGKQFDKGLKRTDHGITSAILIMKAIDKKYKHMNPNQISDPADGWSFSNMENQITNVGSAIFIHNLELDGLVWDFKKAPLATLLKICDELQDWGRPSVTNPKGESPNDYDIKFGKGYLIFNVKKEKLERVHKKIKNVINFPMIIKDKVDSKAYRY